MLHDLVGNTSIHWPPRYAKLASPPQQVMWQTGHPDIKRSFMGQFALMAEYDADPAAKGAHEEPFKPHIQISMRPRHGAPTPNSSTLENCGFTIALVPLLLRMQAVCDMFV